MRALWQDVRYALRLFRRDRGFTAMALVTLGLGLGASTAVYSVVDAVLLRPLPYARSDRIVQVVQVFGRQGTIGDGSASLTSSVVIREVFDAWRASSTTLDALAAFGNRSVTMVSGGEPVRLRASTISPRMFPLLGVAPVAGRLFAESDARPGEEKIALLAETLWRSRFGADPAVIGRRCTLDDGDVTIVGVLPASFAFPQPDTALWVPFVETPPPPTAPGQRFVGGFAVLARLAPGATLDQAEAEGTAVARRVQTALGGFGRPNEDPTVIRLIPLHERIVERVRPALLIVLAAVAVVLLIAAANLAHVLLARGTVRRREMAVRAAIGASRAQLLRQVLVESLMLSLGGGALGVLFAVVLQRLLPALGPATIPRLAEVSIDLRVIGCALGLSIVTALLFGALPALQASRADMTETLAEGSSRQMGGLRPGRHRARGALVAGELAATLVLMVGAALLVQSFIGLLHVDPGYDASNVATAQFTLPSRYPAASRAAFYEELLTRSAALPSVAAAGLTRSLPLTPGRTIAGFSLERAVGSNAAASQNADLRIVSPGYFGALALRLREGRPLLDSDTASVPRVAVVNEAFVREYLHGTPALEASLHVARLDHVRIVGVVGDIRHAALTSAAMPEIYMSLRQLPPPAGAMMLVVRSSGRSSGGAAPLLPAVRALVAGLDASLAVDNAMSMEQRLSASIAEPRFYTALLGAFAGLALSIAVVGIYGVMAYLVAQRRREIGVRVALGARTADVLRLVLGQSLVLVAAGTAAGVAGAVAVTRVLQRFLFQVTPLDAASFAAAVSILALAALGASYVPARRAARLDPVAALRHD